MACEVECKVAIQSSEVSLFTNRIENLFPHACKVEIDKEDIYYGLPDSTHYFRIRKEHEQVTVTQKYKEPRNDEVEVNQEIEFSVLKEDLIAVEQFFSTLGYLPKLEKRKMGSAWQQDALTIELVEVKHLGWFIEIEELLDDRASEEEIMTALENLSNIRQQLGLGNYPLQGRYYSEMLKNLEE